MLLTATVVGSGVMAVNLAEGNAAIALLANTGATVAALICLIALFAPVSGAHFNPAVSLSLAVLGKHTWRDMCLYSAVQIVFCYVGTLLAHAMFGLPLVQVSAQIRTGGAQWLAEVVATFGLLLMMVHGHRRSEDAPWMVAAWIGAAYWFTASTSFANPAITIARSLTNTFSGISANDAPAFVAAQCLGAGLALITAKHLFNNKTPT